MMKRRAMLAIGTMIPWLGACAGAGARPGSIGVVVEYQLALGAAAKKGVDAVTDNGYRIFSPSMLTSTGGGGTNHLEGGPVPRSVRVTWREGKDVGMDWKNGGYTGGTVIGDYTVPVLARISAEAFALARAGRKRFLVLRFRLRDDGVDFGWMVRLQDGVPFEVLMKGGDF